jgi:phosphoglycolate phosphatase
LRGKFSPFFVEFEASSLVNIRCHKTIFSNVEAVIFDKDGTLADSHAFLWKLAEQRIHYVCQIIPDLEASLKAAWGIQANQISPTGLMAVGTRRETEIATAAFIAATGEEWVKSLTIAQSAFEEADRHMGRKADHTPLFDDCKTLLERLHQTQLKLAILSADTTVNVQDFGQRYQLGAYFDLLQGTDEGYSKPDPRLFWQTCAALDVSPAKALMVGDSPADIQMAKAAGAIGCVVVAWGWTEVSTLESATSATTDQFRLCKIQSFNDLEVLP